MALGKLNRQKRFVVLNVYEAKGNKGCCSKPKSERKGYGKVICSLVLMIIVRTGGISCYAKINIVRTSYAHLRLACDAIVYFMSAVPFT